MTAPSEPMCATCYAEGRGGVPAKYVVRGLTGAGPAVTYACARDKPPRRLGLAAYVIGAPRCSAVERDGMPCPTPAWYDTRRTLMGIEARNCYRHKPKRVLVETGRAVVERVAEAPPLRGKQRVKKGAAG